MTAKQIVCNLIALVTIPVWLPLFFVIEFVRDVVKVYRVNSKGGRG